MKKITYVGKENVYNMEVEKYHNFSINKGLIVHNCLDSLRYYINTARPIKKTGYGTIINL